MSDTVQVGIGASDVAAPTSGERIGVDGTIYLIQGAPVRDPERLVWTINARLA